MPHYTPASLRRGVSRPHIPYVLRALRSHRQIQRVLVMTSQSAGVNPGFSDKMVAGVLDASKESTKTPLEVQRVLTVPIIPFQMQGLHLSVPVYARPIMQGQTAFVHYAGPASRDSVLKNAAIAYLASINRIVVTIRA